jgi:4-amino-4-deoxy-L-arabinose transferase-like glycosyltransferase
MPESNNAPEVVHTTVQFPQPPSFSTRQLVVGAIAVLAVFLAYYSWTATWLPLGAGPDSAVHDDVAGFIYQHGRLAVLPDDEDKLKFSPYGTTRATRPPFSYLVTAAMAKLVHREGGNLVRELRFGSVVLIAAATAMVWLTLVLLFRNRWFAWSGALLFGLLPQLAFVASYNNDDSGAVFSATLFVLSLVAVLRRGLTPWVSVLLGTSVGLLILSKLTAWLLLPLGALYVLPWFWQDRRRWALHLSLFAIAFVAAGGWWLIFNVYHYGWHDPLLVEAAREAAQRHARIPDPFSRGFAAQGVGVAQLLIGNYRNFIGESFKSTVGNLDWLKLRMGLPQYGLYLGVFVLALMLFALRIMETIVASFRGRFSSLWTRQYRRRLLLEIVLLGCISLQLAMYVHFNLNHDIQVQGKYLLPVLLPVLILFFGLVDSIAEPLRSTLARNVTLKRRYSGGQVVLGSIGLTGLAIVVGVHVQALLQYVKPFYYPVPHGIKVQRFTPLDLARKKLVQAMSEVHLETESGRWVIESLGQDPWIELKRDVCEKVAVNALIRMTLSADQPGQFRIYLDDGAGFNERRAVSSNYPAGESELLIGLNAPACRRLRLDPLETTGRIVIHEIAFAPLAIYRYE